MATVLVTGGSRGVGRDVVAQLVARGQRVRVYARHEPPDIPAGVTMYRGDLRAGTGLDAATAGVDAIVHCASSSRDEGFATDIAGTRHLVAAARAGGAPHLVYISIVGIDRSPFAYYRAKLAAEDLVARSGLPWTILRATQFHTLVLGLIRSFAANAGDVVTVPEGMRFQSIDQEEVAQRLADQAGRAAAGRVPDLGGPEILTIEGMTETYLRVRGSAARVHPAPLAGALYGAFRSGVNIVPDRAVGRVTWRAFLERTSPPAR